MKEKNGITILSLVITIIVMLILTGITIQLTIGENGLIAKSNNTKEEQAKTELFEIARIEYLKLKTKAEVKDEIIPNVESVLSDTIFLEKYNISGDNIIDKKGNIVDTKENLLEKLRKLNPDIIQENNESGYTIEEEDKEKLILRLKIGKKMKIKFFDFQVSGLTVTPGQEPIIHYDSFQKEKITSYYPPKEKEYDVGEHILKFENITDLKIGNNIENDYEIEIINWGKIIEKNENNNIEFLNVSKIYKPEPDKIPILYSKAKFDKIPEYLFKHKVTSKKMSKFNECLNINEIPKELFKNCIGIERFEHVFRGCTEIAEIPEELFKYNINAKIFTLTFANCKKITTLPEKIFEFNTEAEHFPGTFSGTGLTDIPANIFKNNTKVKNLKSTFYGINITRIPENIFKYNPNIEELGSAFGACFKLEEIPSNLLENNNRIKDCTAMFANCRKLNSVPQEIINKVVNNNIKRNNMFLNCIQVNNYSSIPNEMR